MTRSDGSEALVGLFNFANAPKQVPPAGGQLLYRSADRHRLCGHRTNARLRRAVAAEEMRYPHVVCLVSRLQHLQKGKGVSWMPAASATSPRDIKEERPTGQELRQWQAESGLPLKKFFNTSGQLYRSLALKDKLPTMSEEEQFAPAGQRRHAGQAADSGSGKRQKCWWASRRPTGPPPWVCKGLAIFRNDATKNPCQVILTRIFLLLFFASPAIYLRTAARRVSTSSAVSSR